MIVQLLVQYIIVWYVWKHCTQCVFLGSHDVKEWCGWLWKGKKNGMYLKWRNGPPVMPANGTTSESPGHERYDSPNLKTAHGFAGDGKLRSRLPSTYVMASRLQDVDVSMSLSDAFMMMFSYFSWSPSRSRRKKDIYMAHRCTWNIQWISSLETLVSLVTVSCTWACQAQMKGLLLVTSVQRDSAAMSNCPLCNASTFLQFLLQLLFSQT